MKTKEEITKNWLPRYTSMALEEFGEYILLCNFRHYIESFSQHYGCEIKGVDNNMQACTHNNITIINFGMGSPNAATIMDLLSAITPKAVIFLGKCGSLKDKMPVGSFLLPTAGLRGEGTSDDYYPVIVPALPAFALQKALSTTIREYEQDYWSDTVYTTNRRVWEYDEPFKEYLRSLRAGAIDMETATLFTVGFANHIPVGALLLVSDQPMTPEGVKTDNGDKKVTQNYSLLHLKIGMDSLKKIRDNGETIKHLRW